MNCSASVPVDTRPRQRGPASTDASLWPRSTAPRGRHRSRRWPMYAAAGDARWGEMVWRVARGDWGRMVGIDGGGGWHAPCLGLLPCRSGGVQALIMRTHWRGGFGELRRRFCWLRRAPAPIHLALASSSPSYRGCPLEIFDPLWVPHDSEKSDRWFSQ
uniref:Uncharacterized protein n=1 Tax=Aegilops tauschii subsp. strangulata TaxID=200361 RepID=A0A452YG39_AEGTS